MRYDDIPADTDPDRVTKWLDLFAHTPPTATDLGILREIADRAGDPAAYPGYAWSVRDAWRVYDAAVSAARPGSRWWHRLAVRLAIYLNS
jgi:hypothetical protein